MEDEMDLRERFHRETRLAGRILLVLLLASSLPASPALAGKPVETPGVPDQGWSTGHHHAPRGVVSVAQPLSAKAGAAMLAKGGNAINAAAAIQFALKVEEPMMTGIGGGAFIMI
jgi:gamma-glutamyltranspeptidase/glutathione hydrolase